MIHTLSASINYIDRSCTSKGHYPILSTVTGSLRIVSMTIAAIASTAFLTFHQGASSYYAFSKLDEKKIEQQKNVQQLLSFISQSFKQIGRGLIELIPVIGNLFVLILEYRAEIAAFTQEKNSNKVLKGTAPEINDLNTVDKLMYNKLQEQFRVNYLVSIRQRKEWERVHDERILEYDSDIRELHKKNKALVLENEKLRKEIAQLQEKTPLPHETPYKTPTPIPLAEEFIYQ
ncbi:MAG: hypothetical protein QRY74_01905 [Chlamydia sp.]